MVSNPAHLYISAIAVTLMFLFIAGGLVLFVMLFRSRSARHRMELQQAETRKKNELLQTRIEVQEQALQLVSMEIHDNVGQVLSMVRLMLSDAFRQERTPAELENLIEQSTELLGQSIIDLRRLSRIFSGKAAEDGGLVQALEKELGYIESLYKIRCRFIHPPEDLIPSPDPNRLLLLFRIAQEALQNVVKHAHATEVECCLEFSADVLKLSIRDNGKGMHTDTMPNSNGLGLKSIRERTAMLNGRLEITSSEGKGCLIAVSVPTEGEAGYNILK